MKMLSIHVSVLFIAATTTAFIVSETESQYQGETNKESNYSIILTLLEEERNARAKLSGILSRDILSLRHKISQCQCGTGKITNVKNSNFSDVDEDDLRENITSSQRGLESANSKISSLIHSQNEDVNRKLEMIGDKLQLIVTKVRDEVRRNENQSRQHISLLHDVERLRNSFNNMAIIVGNQSDVNLDFQHRIHDQGI